MEMWKNTKRGNEGRGKEGKWWDAVKGKEARFTVENYTLGRVLR